MLILFLKDIHKPFNLAKQYGLNNPEYRKGQIVSLPEAEAKHYIYKGYAEVAKIRLVAKPAPKLTNAFKVLKIKPQQGTGISLTTLNKNEQELVTSKKWGREVGEYLKANKDISVSDIGDLLLSILDYAIDNKDSQTIERATRDLAVVYKLVRAKRASNDKQ